MAGIRGGSLRVPLKKIKTLRGPMSASICPLMTGVALCRFVWTIRGILRLQKGPTYILF